MNLSLPGSINPGHRPANDASVDHEADDKAFIDVLR